MNERLLVIAWNMAVGLALAVFWCMWLSYGGPHLQSRATESVFLGAVLGGVSVLFLTFSLFNLTHLVWTTNTLGNLLTNAGRFIGKLFLIVWGLAMTAAVAYLLLPHLVH